MFKNIKTKNDAHMTYGMNQILCKITSAIDTQSA